MEESADCQVGTPPQRFELVADTGQGNKSQSETLIFFQPLESFEPGSNTLIVQSCICQA